MTNDDGLTEAIRLIKAGNKEAARQVLEPFLLKNPHHIQAWMWETELFPKDRDKIKVLEICLKQNPGDPQAIKALIFFKKRLDSANNQPVVPISTAPVSPAPPAFKATPSSSYYSTSSIYPDPVVPVAAPQQTAADTPFFESPEPPQPAAPKRPAPQKKSKRMSPNVINAILGILAFVVFIAAVGLYLGGGYYLNGQINQAFAGQNCEAVVQQGSFVSIYPQVIFASMFTGYDQLAECRIKLDVELAVAAKNWGQAFTLAQQYLASYPNGPYAKSLSGQAPEFLSTWSDELIASHDYGTGIEKLKLLLEAYPDSPPAQPAPETIFQTYILWTKELAGKQNFKEAEPLLKTALSYFEADSARSESIKQELVSLYVAWGDKQVQIGDIDNGINLYKKAEEFSPEKIEVELLSARAYLQKALEISKTKNFDKALAKVKEVSDAAQAENIKAEADATRKEILSAYAFSTSPQAINQLTAAIPLMCQGQRPELPIFGLDTEKIRFGLPTSFVKLPDEWVAATPGELHYVICSSESEQEIETCKYTGGHLLTRMRYIWQVTLYDILTGEVTEKTSIKGADPAGCPPAANFLVGSTVSRAYGKRPTADQIVAWLTKLKLTK